MRETEKNRDASKATKLNARDLKVYWVYFIMHMGRIF